MIRSKGEAGTGNVVEAVRHLRSITGRSSAGSPRPTSAELFEWAKQLQAPLPLVQEIAETGKLQVPLFCAGGLATPADAALAMQLGAEAVFVGSGIFKSDQPRPQGQGDRRGHHQLQRPADPGQGQPRARHADDRHRHGRARRAPGRPRLVTAADTGSPGAGSGWSGPGPRVGVLALQGAFARHVEALRRCGVDASEVRTPDHLSRCDALVVPGGESTTMSKLLVTFELDEPLAKLLGDGLPTFGTCAGMILLAAAISDGRPDQLSFGAIDLDVRRNGYGRQVDSFEADLHVEALGQPPLRAAFIRAPVVERVGAGVEVLASFEGVPVLCRQGPVLVSSFHPELSDDDRLHHYFLERVAVA